MSNVSIFNETNNWIKADKILDRIPVLSTIANLVDLFQKTIVIPRMDKLDIDKSEYYAYLNKKSFVRCTLLLLPVLGNIIVAIYDLAKSALNVPKKQVAITPKVVVTSIDDHTFIARMLQQAHFFQRETEILHQGLVMGMPTDPIIINLIPTRVKIEVQSPKFCFNESDISKKHLPELSKWFKQILNKTNLSQNSVEKATKFLENKILATFEMNKDLKAFMTENSILEGTEKFTEILTNYSLSYDEGIFFDMSGSFSIDGFRPFPNPFSQNEREFEIVLKFNCRFLEVDMKQAKDMASDPLVQDWIKKRTGDDLLAYLSGVPISPFPAKYLSVGIVQPKNQVLVT